MTHVKTPTGFTCEIDEAKLDNMELLEDLVAFDAGGPMAALSMSSFLDKLIGKEEKKRLYDHVRIDGRVPVGAVAREVMAIIQGFNSGKK